MNSARPAAASRRAPIDSVRPPRTLPDLLRLRADEEPERVAVRRPGSTDLTFGEWQERSSAVAQELRQRGVGEGESVGLVYPESAWADYAVAFLGVLLAGAVAVPLSTRSAPAEIRGALSHSRAVGVVSPDGDVAPDDGWALRERSQNGGTSGGWYVPVSPEDPAQLLYTSGTTGRPKAVVASHGNLAHGCTADRRRRPLGHSRLFLHGFPIGTNAGQIMLVNALNSSAAALPVARFVPGQVGRLIAEEGVGTLFVVPAMAVELLSSRVHERYDLSSLMLVGSTAAALPPAVAVGLTTALPGATIVNYYTSTEASPAQTTMVIDPARPGSVGRPIGDGLRVLGPDGERVPVGETGEIWLRPPAWPRAYLGEAASSVFRDGWVRMGDLGRLDDAGYLYLVDREGDVVKSGAFKVSTLQVEAALHEHPDIAEAAVVGIPHPVLGTAVAAVVVADAPLTLPDVRRFLADTVSAHALPTRLLLVEALPHNAAGKVLKAQLREWLTRDVPPVTVPSKPW